MSYFEYLEFLNKIANLDKEEVKSYLKLNREFQRYSDNLINEIATLAQFANDKEKFPFLLEFLNTNAYRFARMFKIVDPTVLAWKNGQREPAAYIRNLFGYALTMNCLNTQSYFDFVDLATENKGKSKEEIVRFLEQKSKYKILKTEILDQIANLLRVVNQDESFNSVLDIMGCTAYKFGKLYGIHPNTVLSWKKQTADAPIYILQLIAFSVLGNILYSAD